MARSLNSVLDVAKNYDAVILDQWGVLHNGTAAYPGAFDVLRALADADIKTAVLSNSGKRADLNRERICSMGFDTTLISHVMSSGEALWQDMNSGKIGERAFFPIEAKPGDCALWARGLGIEIASLEAADALLLMGLPDRANIADWLPLLKHAKLRELPLYCSNPDLKSPRKNHTVTAPGTIARAYAEIGGSVTFYGKPHPPVFEAVASVLTGERFLMIGDSLEHDIAGANTVGWDSVLIQNGLYRDLFSIRPADDVIANLATQYGASPTFTIPELS